MGYQLETPNQWVDDKTTHRSTVITVQGVQTLCSVPICLGRCVAPSERWPDWWENVFMLGTPNQ